MSAAPHIPPLRDVGSTTPTRRVERATSTVPSGWSCSRHYDGSQAWTWCDDELPIVRVLVSPAGVAPAHVSHPHHYRMDLAQVQRAAQALVELCRHLAERARGAR